MHAFPRSCLRGAIPAQNKVAQNLTAEGPQVGVQQGSVATKETTPLPLANTVGNVCRGVGAESAAICETMLSIDAIVRRPKFQNFQKTEQLGRHVSSFHRFEGTSFLICATAACAAGAGRMFRHHTHGYPIGAAHFTHTPPSVVDNTDGAAVCCQTISHGANGEEDEAGKEGKEVKGEGAASAFPTAAAAAAPLPLAAAMGVTMDACRSTLMVREGALPPAGCASGR